MNARFSHFLWQESGIMLFFNNFFQQNLLRKSTSFGGFLRPNLFQLFQGIATGGGNGVDNFHEIRQFFDILIFVVTLLSNQCSLFIRLVCPVRISFNSYTSNPSEVY